MGSAEKVFLTIWAVLFFGPVLKAIFKGKGKDAPPKRAPAAPPPVVLRRRPGGAPPVPPAMPRPRPAAARGGEPRLNSPTCSRSPRRW